ncbi:unnamed protein product [Callosobruchus maculatus]|uniref:Integral membrane protein 2 n=1 Tax=Callosobruchus maculatus TaxID=64391 RepID=A0A653DPN8_CALMS|nr:unnamed protein product [Callosobruchus maculatus]
MTILTKPFSEKKGDKLGVPLVDNELLAPPSAPEDVEAQSHPRIIIFPARAHRVSTATTLCVLLTALFVVGIGIVGGKVLYNEYLSVSRQIQAREEWPQPAKYEGVAIPMRYEDNMVNTDMELGNMDDDAVFEKMINKLINNKRGEFFQENFEIDDDRKYEKIDVPDFRDGRAGRFIHDFNTNITGIIDITGRR